MADSDGLIVNFHLGTGPLRQKEVFKGGKWKDRALAKKNARWRVEKLEPGDASVNGATSGTKKPFQRESDQLQDQDHDNSDRPTKKLKRSQNVAILGAQKSPQSQREIISSLFTSNPTTDSPIVTQKAGEVDGEVKASNAPLDGLENFTGLGLSVRLATHLLQKLNLRGPTAIQREAIQKIIKEDSDVFLQAETGSGKTLAYLLPIVHRLIEISSSTPKADRADSQIHRNSGLFTIIVAPTRELCKQISHVLDEVLRCANWIVCGAVTGGEKKSSEKARLRKGLNILVATPGRLVDHLKHTKALDISPVRWLVLDEGDRLMELGFEDDIKQIISKLDSCDKNESRGQFNRLPPRRINILCSATLKMQVQKLGEMSLKDALHIKVDPETTQENGAKVTREAKSTDSPHCTSINNKFLVPTQLKQSYLLCPPKQRLVTLAALLRQQFSNAGPLKNIIVFLSCADSVDFHFELFTLPVSSLRRVASEFVNGQGLHGVNPDKVERQEKRKPLKGLPPSEAISRTASPAPFLSTDFTVTIYRLHGSLQQQIRTSTLKAFATATTPAILFCTDVASRGLDLPNIDLVIEYDPPFSAEEHLHRVGRTARAGKDGRAITFLMPGKEEGYVELLKEFGDRQVPAMSAEDVMKIGFASKSGHSEESKSKKKSKDAPVPTWSDAATEYQLELERWITSNSRAVDLARKAYISHVRAYATHIANERHIFDVKDLHLGHIAKAFALRERPGYFGRGVGSRRNAGPKFPIARRVDADSGNDVRFGKGGKNHTLGEARADDDDTPREVSQGDAAKKMKAALQRHMARANEFNIG